MKNIFRMTFVLLMFCIALAACGSKKASDPPPKTKAVTTLYLFGTMSSSSTIDHVKAEITVPDGLTVDISTTPAGDGFYVVTSGTIVPSGPVLISGNDVYGEYNESTRKLIIEYRNFGDSGTGLRKDVKSGTAGSGIEIALLNFKLTKSNVEPSSPATWSDSSPEIWVFSGSETVVPVSGLHINYSTKYLP